MKMLGDSAVWGIVMQAPSRRQVLPRSLPPPPPDVDVPLRRALLPPHLVQPAAAKSTSSEATFRSAVACWGVWVSFASSLFAARCRSKGLLTKQRRGAWKVRWFALAHCLRSQRLSGDTCSSFARPADPKNAAMKERQKEFQGDVERMRKVLHKLTLPVQQGDALGARVASLRCTIDGQRSRSGRAAAIEAAAKAAAAAAAAQQERMFGGRNVCVEELSAGEGMQLLLIDPLFEFHEGTHALLSSGMSPQLLLHAQVRCHVALTRAGQERARAVVQQYLDAATLLSKLCMFGGSDDAVAEAGRGAAAAVCEMQELLAQPQLQSSDLHRLLSLNTAYFLQCAPMRRALLALLSEQLQACTHVAQVLDMWPQLVQQCSPRFLAFLRQPGADVSDDELIGAPPPADAGQCAAVGSDDDGEQSDGSAAMQLRDLSAQDAGEEQQERALTYHHFLHSLSLLSSEQRKALLAARCLMTRAGVAWEMQQAVMCSSIQRMGAHFDVHTEHVELFNGRRLAAFFPPVALYSPPDSNCRSAVRTRNGCSVDVSLV
jgi:hypothetical protein